MSAHFQRSVLFHSAPGRPVAGRDLSQLAKSYGIPLEVAEQTVKNEGWFFTGYNDAGEECFVSPVEETEARSRLGEPDTEWVITLNSNPEYGLDLDAYYDFKITVMSKSRKEASDKAAMMHPSCLVVEAVEA